MRLFIGQVLLQPVLCASVYSQAGGSEHRHWHQAHEVGIPALCWSLCDLQQVPHLRLHFLSYGTPTPEAILKVIHVDMCTVVGPREGPGGIGA